MAISKELLEILACPQCKGEVTLTPAGDGLVCTRCKLEYAIKDDIPNMLIDEARRRGHSAARGFPREPRRAPLPRARAARPRAPRRGAQPGPAGALRR